MREGGPSTRTTNTSDSAAAHTDVVCRRTTTSPGALPVTLSADSSDDSVGADDVAAYDRDRQEKPPHGLNSAELELRVAAPDTDTLTWTLQLLSEPCRKVTKVRGKGTPCIAGTKRVRYVPSLEAEEPEKCTSRPVAPPT